MFGQRPGQPGTREPRVVWTDRSTVGPGRLVACAHWALASTRSRKPSPSANRVANPARRSTGPVRR